MPDQHRTDAEGTLGAADVFNEALDLPPAERSAFLDRACRNGAQRRDVEKLLRSHDDLPTGFLPSREEVHHPIGTRIGSYVLLGCLGEGGMGTVYSARQDFPRREVALKLIRPGRISEGLVQRFEKEVQALGSLQHPGIAQIFDAGTARFGGPEEAQREEPFLAMELVRGLPLLDHAESKGLNARQRLELIARVAEAVHHAHQRGVIHRDLKPENVLVTDEETRADDPAPSQMGLGQPKVLDFGIARITNDGATGVTRDGELVGTLSHMSPEQFEGAGNIDERSDVYALGVLAYQLLCGRLPHDFSGLSIPRAIHMLRTTRPVPLSQHDPHLRGDVATIVGRALEEEPGRRYPTAAALAEDIRRYLHGAPIQARSNSTFYLLRRKVSRHRLAVAAGAAFLILGAVFALQLRDKRVLAKESDEQLQQTLDSIAQFERFSVDYLEQSPKQREFLLSILAQQRRLLDGHDEQVVGRLASAHTRAIVGVLSHVLGEPNAFEDLNGAIEELEALRGSVAGVDTQLAMAFKEMALLREQEGALDEAEELLLRAIELDDLSTPWRAALVAHLARLKRARADFDLALELYDDALTMLADEELVFEDMAYTTRWDCIGMIGSLQAERGLLDEAAHTFEALEEMLPDLDRVSNPVFKSQAVVHLNNMANLAFMRGEAEDVPPLMERAMQFSEELLELSPNHMLFRREMLTTLLNLGSFHAHAGRFEEARRHTVRGEELAAELMRFAPDAPRFPGMRGILLFNLGLIDIAEEAFEAALPRFDKAIPLLERASAALPGHVEWQAAIPEARMATAHCLIRIGRHGEGVRTAADASVEQIDPDGWRRLELFSLAIGAVHEDETLSPEDRSVVIEEYVEMAIQYVSQMLDASGSKDLSRLSDTALLPHLLAEPTFVAFLELILG